MTAASPALAAPTPNITPDIDIFCRVIDNYGDIGVCWRVARCLAHDYQQHIRLWVDDLASFARLEPTVQVHASTQQIAGIEVCAWQTNSPWPTPAPQVIEAFACDLPDAFCAQLTPQTRWMNLEYLSAEDWVESCHGLPSPQANGALKHFIFPGFSDKTGGILREFGYRAERDAWQADPVAREQWLIHLGLAPHLAHDVIHGERRLITVFCYPSAPLQDLLTQVAQASWSSVVLLAGGSGADTAISSDNMALHRIPFLTQPEYDRLLWSADLNCVRGEDSFVRAQLAGRPMLWHIYPQAEQAHHTKLEAWLAKAHLPNSLAACHRYWNQEPDERPNDWARHVLDTLPAAWEDWNHWAQAWADYLFELPNLAETLLTPKITQNR